MKPWQEYFFSVEVKRQLSALPYRGVQLMGRSRYVPYLLVSAISLCIDLGIFYFMLRINMAAVQAASLGYVSGLVIPWLLSSRLVFSDKFYPTIALRRRQKKLFLISALAGLIVTVLVMKSGLWMGLEPGFAKLAAVVLSVHLTYMLRRTFIVLDKAA
jgi:putative flippase GtrA